VLLVGAVLKLAGGAGAAEAAVEKEEEDSDALSFVGQPPAMVGVDALQQAMAAELA
jgi:hypothetical protein